MMTILMMKLRKVPAKKNAVETLNKSDTFEDDFEDDDDDDNVNRKVDSDGYELIS